MTKQNHTLQLPQMLTTEQAASYLNIKSSTLNTWRSLSRGPAYQKFGRSVRYRIETLREWVEDQTHTSTTFRGQQSY